MMFSEEDINFGKGVDSMMYTEKGGNMVNENINLMREVIIEWYIKSKYIEGMAIVCLNIQRMAIIERSEHETLVVLTTPSKLRGKS